MSVIPMNKSIERMPNLEQVEKEIENIQTAAFVDLGERFAFIRDNKLYKDRYTSFEDYCWMRWARKSSSVYKIISACETYKKLCTFVHILPNAEGQIRPLVPLKDEKKQVAAWNKAVEVAGGKTPTEQQVKEAIKSIKEEERQEQLKSAKQEDQPTPEPIVETQQEERQPVIEAEPLELMGQSQPKTDREVSHDRKIPNHILLDEWKGLDENFRQELLRGVDSDKPLNKQDNASIEWAQWSWNPITGCRHDCPYCYARDIANRFYSYGFEPAFMPDRIRAPFNTNVPAIAKNNPAFKNIFVCSMADLFGRWVPREWIECVFEQVKQNPQWSFLFLTKFPKRMSEFDYPKNAWLGTTVDCQARVKNAEDAFAKVKCGIKWLSVEPMLERLKFERLDLFDWIVIGGASESSKTPAWIPPIDWIVDLHQQARKAGCKIYYKTNCGMQDDLRIKEFPWNEYGQKQLPDVFRYLGKSKNSQVEK